MLLKKRMRLKETHKNLNNNYTKLGDAFGSVTRESAKLKKAHDDHLQVISNLRESLALETIARKDVETRASSLEIKLQEKEEVLSKLRVLGATRIEGLITIYSGVLKQFGA